MNKCIIGLLLAIAVALSCMNFRVKEEKIDVGKFSISLAVKDLQLSMSFYKSLGFTQLEGAGSLDDNWIIMTNGGAKIGLFQGMFPTNTITFNPTDARAIKAHLQSEGIITTFETGFDKSKGPCTMALTDPDGNPILIDQH